MLRSRRDRNLAPSFPEVRSGHGPDADATAPDGELVVREIQQARLRATPGSPPAARCRRCPARRAVARPLRRLRLVAPGGHRHDQMAVRGRQGGCSGTPFCRTEPHRAVGAVPVVPPAGLGIHETADRALKAARATCRPSRTGADPQVHRGPVGEAGSKAAAQPGEGLVHLQSLTEHVGTSRPSPRRHLSSSPRAARLPASAHNSGQRSRGTRAPPGSRWHRSCVELPVATRHTNGGAMGAIAGRRHCGHVSGSPGSLAEPEEPESSRPHGCGPPPGPPPESPAPECLPRCPTGAQSEPRPVVRRTPGGGDALGRHDQEVFFRLRLMHSERTAVRVGTGEPRTDSEDGQPSQDDTTRPRDPAPASGGRAALRPIRRARRHRDHGRNIPRSERY